HWKAKKQVVVLIGHHAPRSVSDGRDSPLRAATAAATVSGVASRWSRIDRASWLRRCASSDDEWVELSLVTMAPRKWSWRGPRITALVAPPGAVFICPTIVPLSSVAGSISASISVHPFSEGDVLADEGEGESVQALLPRLGAAPVGHLH